MYLQPQEHVCLHLKSSRLSAAALPAMFELLLWNTALYGSGWHWQLTQTDTLSTDKRHSELKYFPMQRQQVVTAQHQFASHLHVYKLQHFDNSGDNAAPVCMYTNFTAFWQHSCKMSGTFLLVQVIDSRPQHPPRTSHPREVTHSTSVQKNVQAWQVVAKPQP